MKSFYLLITLMLTVGVAFGDGTDEPVIAFDGDTLIPFSNSDEDNSFVGSIRSVQGECDATAEVIEGSNWLKIEGATLKRYHLNSGESAQVNYTIDRYMIGANTGFATVRFSTSVQALDIRYVIQSGTRGGGYAIYSTDFENMEDGSILGQPCWKAAGAVNDCLVMEDPDEPENRCLKIGQAQALHTIVSFPDDAYKTYDVKISGRIKYPSEATKSVVTFGTDLNAPDRYGEYSLRHTNSGIQFTADNCEDVNIENYARYDKWFTFSYSFNTDPENPVLRFVTFDGVQYELNKPLKLSEGWGRNGNFAEFRNYTWNNSASYYMDDIRIELIKAGTIPEPAVLGLLALAAAVLLRRT